jgi:large subunit ribosomal protein L23
MNAFIVKAPVITEKSMLKAQAQRVYTFYVDPTANKQQIAESVEKTFGVNVIDVHTSSIAGKSKRTGKKRMEMQTNNRKKAMVTLKEGQSIAVFDVQEKA